MARTDVTLRLPKEMRATVRKLLRRGWELERTGTSHLQLRGPSGEVVPLSTNQQRGPACLRVLLRRLNVEV